MALEFGADIIVTLDSDGQHNPNEIPQVLKPILEGRADLVVGSRFMSHKDYLDEASYACGTYYFEKQEYGAIHRKIPCYRKFGIDIINWLYNVCNGNKLIDTQSCFRAYTRQLIEKLTIEEDGFGFSTEVLIKARKKKVRMVEVPISCIYHRLEQDSTMNPLKHGFLVAYKTVKWRIKLWA
jgi:glycosyltransferase involved in cell wall biosynthesis